MHPGCRVRESNLVDRHPFILEQPVRNQVKHQGCFKNGKGHVGLTMSVMKPPIVSRTGNWRSGEQEAIGPTISRELRRQDSRLETRSRCAFTRSFIDGFVTAHKPEAERREAKPARPKESLGWNRSRWRSGSDACRHPRWLFCPRPRLAGRARAGIHPLTGLPSAHRSFGRCTTPRNIISHPKPAWLQTGSTRLSTLLASQPGWRGSETEAATESHPQNNSLASERKTNLYPGGPNGRSRACKMD